MAWGLSLRATLILLHLAEPSSWATTHTSTLQGLLLWSH